MNDLVKRGNKMNYKKDLVSVIMSVFNTPEYMLREAINSVLAQTYSNLEFIIVDDCSDESTKRILAEYSNDSRIRLLYNEKNEGLTKNLNKMILCSNGEYIARMDSDDVCMYNRIERQVEFLKKNKHIGLLATGYEVFGDVKKKHVKIENSPSQIKARLLFCNSGILHSSVIMRAELLMEKGILYNENVKKSQDFDMWIRLAKVTKLYILPEVLMRYRTSSVQISTSNRAEQSDYRKKIILDEIEYYMPDITYEEKQIHLALCDGRVFDQYKNTTDWANKIIKNNEKNNSFDMVALKKYTYEFLVRALYHEIRNIKVIPVFGLYTIMYCFWKLIGKIYFTKKA